MQETVLYFALVIVFLGIQHFGKVTPAPVESDDDEGGPVAKHGVINPYSSGASSFPPQLYSAPPHPIYYPPVPYQPIIPFPAYPPPQRVASNQMSTLDTILILLAYRNSIRNNDDVEDDASTEEPPEDDEDDGTPGFDYSEWYLADNGCRYNFYLRTVPFSQAISRCEQVGATLAVKGMRGISSDDLELRKDILNGVGAASSTIPWVGLRLVGPNYQWIDGVPTVDSGSNQNTDWAAGEPSSESCGIIAGIIAQFLIFPCSGSDSYLCEHC